MPSRFCVLVLVSAMVREGRKAVTNFAILPTFNSEPSFFFLFILFTKKKKFNNNNNKFLLFKQPPPNVEQEELTSCYC